MLPLEGRVWCALPRKAGGGESGVPYQGKLVVESLVCPPEESWWGRVWCTSPGDEGLVCPTQESCWGRVCLPAQEAGGGESCVLPWRGWSGVPCGFTKFSPYTNFSIHFECEISHMR